MIELKDQVVSFELAMKLNDLGVEQNSLFYWVLGDFIVYTKRKALDKEYISAFTVAELLSFTPGILYGDNFQLLKGHIFEESKPTYVARYFNAGLIGEPDKNPANAIAKLLIYLIESGIVKVEDLNK